MKVLCFIVCLVAVCAEPPVPERFRGYEKGGYEIGSDEVKTFPGADQLNFPGISDANGGSEVTGASSSQPSGSTGDFPSNKQEAAPVGRSSGQQRGNSRFQGGEINDIAGGGDGEGEGGSLDDIPGVPGKDYPIYGEIPKTSFSCDQQTSPGYYADIETQCQVFHICQKGGQMNSVLCPNGTIFNQRVFVCSWWYDFDCDSAQALFALNEQVNAEGEAASARAGQRGGVQSSSLRGDQGSRESLENGGYQDNGPQPAKLSNFPQGGGNVNEIEGIQNIPNVGSPSGLQEADLTTSDGYPREDPQGSLGSGDPQVGGPGYARGRGRGGERRSQFEGHDGGEQGYSRGGNIGGLGGGGLSSQLTSSGEGVGQANTERGYLPPS